MINLALIVGVYTGGGIGVVVGSLLKEFRRLGVDVTVVTKKAVAKDDAVKVAEAKSHSPDAISELKKFDAVHVMGGSTLVVPALLCGKPSVFTFQGQTPPELRGSYRKYAMAHAIEMLYGATMKRFDVVTCASRFGQKDVRRRYGVEESIWIPNGVDRKIFRKAESGGIGRLRKKFSHPLLLGVGNLYPEKGWERTLDYFEEFLGEERGSNLLIAGDGILRGTLQRRIDGSMLKGKVHLLGEVPLQHLYEYYNASDAYVSGSLYEGFCLPAIEALACGKGLIVRDIGAMREHALQSKCGAVFTDANSFGKAAEKVLGMEEKMLQQSAEKYLMPFSWRNAAEKYAEIYRELIG